MYILNNDVAYIKADLHVVNENEVMPQKSSVRN